MQISDARISHFRIIDQSVVLDFFRILDFIHDNWRFFAVSIVFNDRSKRFDFPKLDLQRHLILRVSD